MSVEHLRIAFIGNRKHSTYVLRHLLERGRNVVCAIGATGETAEKQAGNDSMESVCEEFEVPHVETSDINSRRVRKLLREADPRIGLCCGWTQLITADVREIPDDGILGFHFSPLPRGRGGAPVNWQIINGHDEVGVSLFRLVGEVDHGEIFGQTTVPIETRDDVSTVYNRLTNATCSVLDEVLPQIATRSIEPTEQSFEHASYYPRRKPVDGLIDWERSADKQFNWIRAQTKPYPGAFTFYEGKKVTIWQSTPRDEKTDAVSGTVLRCEPGGGVDVSSGGEVLRLERVELHGEAPAWGDSFAARHDVGCGDRFGEPSDFPDWLYTGLRDGSGGFDFETNVSKGDTGMIQAVCCSHERERSVAVTVRFGEVEIYSHSLCIDGWTTCTIPFTPPDSGSRLLRVRFEEDGETVDTRRMMVYTPESVH